MHHLYSSCDLSPSRRGEGVDASNAYRKCTGSVHCKCWGEQNNGLALYANQRGIGSDSTPLHEDCCPEECLRGRGGLIQPHWHACNFWRSAGWLVRSQIVPDWPTASTASCVGGSRHAVIGSFIEFVPRQQIGPLGAGSPAAASIYYPLH